MSFEALGLSENVMKAISDLGYEKPTPIQAKAIPIVLMGRDLIGLAQTGTGKTASFTLPMIEILAGGRAKARMPRSLILAPTRELAAQVAANFEQYGKYEKLAMALLVGGESMGEQIKKLERGVDVLIATPGRLLDLFDRGQILLNDIKVLVIDEADRMMDMGFIPDIEKIASKLPMMRQTLLFSATMPKAIQGLAEKFLSNPKQVEVARPATTAETVEQSMVWLAQKDKFEALDVLLQAEEVKNAFVFCNRKRDVDKLAIWLKSRKYKVRGMHGDMAQTVRTETLKSFKDGETVLLVCSDVAARGIDVKAVSHVFNMDIPMTADDYVHRIGRTGRAGEKGHAWSFATPEDRKYVSAVEKLIGGPIDVCEIEGIATPGAKSEGSTNRRDSNQGRQDGNKGNSRGGSQRPKKQDNRAENKTEQSDSQKPTQKSAQPQKPRDNNRSAENKPKPDRNNQRGRDSNRGRPVENDLPNVVGFGNELPDFLR